MSHYSETRFSPSSKEFSLVVQKPSLFDIPAMQQLVEPEVKSGIILSRSDNEIANAIRSYFIAMDNSKIVGFTALHIHTYELAEVRSLIVESTYRGKGVGKALVLGAIEEAKKLGIKEVLSLTYEPEFFRKLGFVEIPKESIPEHKIWADCIRCKHFPICNEISLIKKL